MLTRRHPHPLSLVSAAIVCIQPVFTNLLELHYHYLGRGQIEGSRIAIIIGFSVKIPTFHSGFNTRGGASLQLHLFPIKLGCLADMKIHSYHHTRMDLLKHTKLVFYRSLMSLEYMLTKLKLIFMIMPFFWEGHHHAPPPPAVCCDRVRKYLRSFLFHTGKIPKLLNCTNMHH